MMRVSKEDVLLFGTYGIRGTGKSYYEKLKEKDKEIERLNNNWNELKQWIEKERDKWEKYHPDCFVYYQSILDRMEEIKGVDK